MTNLQGKANAAQQPAAYSWDEISKLIGGEPFNYDLFKQEYDSNNGLQQLVKNFNADGVEVKTNNDDTEEGYRDPIGGKGIKSMARRAALKMLKK